MIYLPRILQVLRLSSILKFIVEIIEIGNLKGRVLECLHERKKEEKKRRVRSRSRGEMSDENVPREIHEQENSKQ